MGKTGKTGENDSRLIQHPYRNCLRSEHLWRSRKSRNETAGEKLQIDIIQEEGGQEKAVNPIVLGWAFNTLLRPHHAKAQDPDAIYRTNARVALPVNRTSPDKHAGKPNSTIIRGLQRSAPKRKKGERIHAYHDRPQYETADITWGEEAASLKRCVIGYLMDQKDYEPLMEESVATTIQDRLLNEILAAGFLELPKRAFAGN